MSIHSLLQPFDRKGTVYRFLSIPLSVLAAAAVYYFKIPNPMMILIIPVVYFTYSEGFFSGMLSGVVAVLYSCYYFLGASHDRDAGAKLMTIFLAVAAIIFLVGKLKARDNRRFKELQETQENLEHAKERAEELSRTKSDFLSMMSHEIRTPINAIIGMSGIARKSDDPGKVRDCLDKIDASSAHLLGVINDILDMSKIEAGKFELSCTDFVIERMLERVVAINQVRIEQKLQKLTIVVDSGVPTAIVSDQQRLAQVITNLLSNASKFSPDEGKIELTIGLLEETEGMVKLQFTVKDEGIGMTEEQLSHLFRAFEQADNSITRRFGGTGLGLAISKTIVESLGGAIWAESELGIGSAFIFEFTASKGAASRAENLNPHVDWTTVRLMAVDSSGLVLQYFHTMMDALGIKCDIAATAEDAMQLLREQAYQIVFIDRHLPGAGGAALCRRIHAEYPNQILILTGFGDWSEPEADAKASGIQSFLRKPLMPSPLTDCINKCLGGNVLTEDLCKEELRRDLFLGRHLLLADDVEMNREIIKSILEETGIEVTEVENGQEVCTIFEQSPTAFDLILMDIHMPFMDGYAATRYIREREQYPAAAVIPILAMTADVQPADIKRCLDAGMNGHIGKPINPEELLLKIKRCIPSR